MDNEKAKRSIIEACDLIDKGTPEKDIRWNIASSIDKIMEKTAQIRSLARCIEPEIDSGILLVLAQLLKHKKLSSVWDIVSDIHTDLKERSRLMRNLVEIHNKYR